MEAILNLMSQPRSQDLLRFQDGGRVHRRVFSALSRHLEVGVDPDNEISYAEETKTKKLGNIALLKLPFS